MASNIKFKRSAVQNRVPTTAQLELGELALNTYDGKLYTEINTGSAAVVEIGSKLSSLVVDGDNGGGNGDVTFHGTTANRDLLWDASADSLIAKDNAKIVVGDGTDLSIYSDGTNGLILSDALRLKNKSGGDVYLKADSGAAVELYHNDVKRFETTADGVDISGTGSLKLPVGTTAQRNGSPTAGDMRYNSTTGSFEGYTTGWGALGGESGVGIGSTSINPGSGVVGGRIGVGFTDINFVGAGLSVTGYGSTVVVDISDAVSRRYGRNVYTYTATEGQTTFTGLSYTNATIQISVYLNGARLSASAYTATSGHTVVLATGASVGDNVEILELFSGVNLSRTLHSFTATAGQTTFTGLSYIKKKDLDVYLNGIRLSQTDYTATDGASIVLSLGASVNDLIEVIDMGAGATWSVGGTEPEDVYRLDGGVGIGTSNPTDKLNVIGNARVVGILTVGTGSVTIDNTTVKTGTSNLHNVGIEVAGINVLGADTPIGVGATIYNTGGALFAGTSGIVTATAFHGDGSQLTGIVSDKIFEGNTEVETVDTGSDGHVKITTEGTERARIDSAGNMSLGKGSAASTAYTTQLQIHSTNSTGAALHLTNSTSGSSNTDGFHLVQQGDIYHWLRENANQVFATNNTERMRLTSSGRLLLGTTTEGAATADEFTIATSGNTGMTIRSGTSNEGNIFFSDGTSGDAEYRGMLRYEHNNDAMVIKTAATERLRITNAGKFDITNPSSGNVINLGSSTEYANAAINIHRLGNGYADMRLSSNYGAKVALAGANNNTDELYIQQDNQKNAYIYNEATAGITFGTSNTGRMWLDSSGNFKVVGISTFNSSVHVSGDLDVAADIRHIGDTDTRLRFETDTISIRTGGTARVTVTNATTTVANNLTVTGNLQVDGTQTTVNSTTMTVDDKNIVLGSGAANDAAADGGGITLESGDGNKTWNWVDATDAWTSSEHIHLGDSKKLLLGASSDLQLFHDGSNSYLNNSGTGSVVHRVTNGDIYFQYYDGSSAEDMAVFKRNGAVELYYNNAARFVTSNDGATLTGRLNPAANNTYGLGQASLRWANFYSVVGNFSGTLTVDSEINARRLTLSDDGSASPTFMLKTDDASPWGFIIKNDTYSTDNTVGFKAYQGNDGNLNLQVKGASEYNQIFFSHHNGTSNRSLLTFNASGNATFGGSVTTAGGTLTSDLSINDNSYIRVRATGSNSSTAIQLEHTGAASFTGTVTANAFSGSGASLTNVNATTLDSIDSGSFLRSDVDDEIAAKLTVRNDNGLVVRSATNAAGAKINFSDHASGSYGQNGTLTYKHSDGSISTTGGNSNDGWLFSGSETRTVVKVAGVLEATTTIYSNGGEVWHSSNDGSGSGLDADLLDGVQGSNYLRSNAADSMSAKLTLNQDNDNEKLVLAGTGSPLIRFQEGTTNKAFIQWHEGGYIRLQNDEDDSILKIQDDIVFSMDDGSTYHKVWHAGNDGSGTGLDADLLDGVQGASYLRSDANDTYSGVLTLNGMQIHAGNTSQNLKFLGGTGTDVGLTLYNASNAWTCQLYGTSSGYYGFLNSNWGSWDMKKAPNGQLTLRIGSTDQTVWHTGNDGSGSGLDADTLDGNQASAFPTLSGSNSFSNSYNEFGNSTGSVSNDGSWNARVNVAGSQHARLDVKSVSDGIITTMYAHTGHNAGRVGTLSNHKLILVCNGNSRAELSTSGSLSTTVQGTLWGASNDAGLFSKSHTQTAQLQLRSHTNSWNGGIKFISQDGNNSAQLHMDNSSTYDLMVDSAFYVGGHFITNGVATFNGDATFNGGAGAVTIPAAGDIRFSSGTWTGESMKIQGHANRLYVQGGSDGVIIRGSDGGDIAHFMNGQVSIFDDTHFSAGTGAVTITANSDIRFGSGNWTGEAMKIQGHGSSLYVQGGSGGIYLRASNGTNALLATSSSLTSYVDHNFQGGAGAITIAGNSDIRLSSGNWTGESCKIQHHSNWLYLQGGSNGHVFRRSNGDDAWYINSSGHLLPATDSIYDFGTNTSRIQNIFGDRLALGDNGGTPSARLAIQDNSGYNIYLEGNGWSGEAGIGFGGSGTGNGVADGSTGARIACVSSAPSGQAHGYLKFYTNPGDNLTERVRIRANGDLDIRTQDASSMTNTEQRLRFTTHQTNGQSASTAAIVAKGVSGWGGNLEFWTKDNNGTPNEQLRHTMTLQGDNGRMFMYGDIHFDGAATTTSQNRQIYWTGFDKEGTSDYTDVAGIEHTTNTGGLSGSVLKIRVSNDASGDGIYLDANGGVNIANTMRMQSGNIQPRAAENSIKWQNDAFGGGGDYARLDYYRDGSGENTRLRLQIENDNDDDLRLEAGTIRAQGSFSKSGGSFLIPHPNTSAGISTTHNLAHSFIEGPQMDLIYRGKVDLVGGTASINIDTKAKMAEGTFVILCKDIQCFTSNETGWGSVKGSVSGNILTITAQDNSSTDTISWMVVGERQDPTVKSLKMTDDDGEFIVQPPKDSFELNGILPPLPAMNGAQQIT